MVWVRLDNQTEDAQSTALTTANFTSKTFIEVIMANPYVFDNLEDDIQVGNGTIDTATNYADRVAINNGSDGTNTTTAQMNVGYDGGTQISNVNIINIAGEEKLFIVDVSEMAGADATSAPQKLEGCGKWDNTSNQIDIFRMKATTGGRKIEPDAKIIVNGYD